MFEGALTTSVLRVVQRLVVSLTARRSILFLGTYLSGRKTPMGPVAGHYKKSHITFRSLLRGFLLFFRQRFLK